MFNNIYLCEQLRLKWRLCVQVSPSYTMKHMPQIHRDGLETSLLEI